MIDERRARTLVFAGVLAAAFARAAIAVQQGLPPELDAHVQKVREAFDVPGIAVAIVKDGATVLAKGYGVKRLNDPALVTENTLFGIASNTKAFTTAALAILVDEGKIAWDDRVQDRLPGFAMYDPYVSREITVRDLLCHRAGQGLGKGDLLWWPGTTFTRDEIVHRLRFLKPASSFRSKYAYDNVLYIAAGQIIPAVTGKSWEAFVRDRIFAPLGMKTSNTSTAAYGIGVDHAWPHTVATGKARAIELMTIENAGPAGSINSSAAEMASWIAMQLGRGRIPQGDGRIFSEARSREMWSAHIDLPIGEPRGPLAALTPRFSSYGLGWFLRDYHGRKLVGHTGGVTGFYSRVFLVPEANLGVVVLTNADSGGAFESVGLAVLDHYLGVPPTDWISAFAARAAENRRNEQAAESRRASERDASSKPSLGRSRYAGVYRDAWYGTVTIVEDGEGLVMRMDRTPRAVGDLQHWQYDTFKIVWRDSVMENAFATFALDAKGAIDHVKMVAVSPEADFSFDYHDLHLVPERDGQPGGK
jgi:CubicO group peptidase (beta-lactamase class C family)